MYYFGDYSLHVIRVYFLDLDDVSKVLPRFDVELDKSRLSDFGGGKPYPIYIELSSDDLLSAYDLLVNSRYYGKCAMVPGLDRERSNTIVGALDAVRRQEPAVLGIDLGNYFVQYAVFGEVMYK